MDQERGAIAMNQQKQQQHCIVINAKPQVTKEELLDLLNDMKTTLKSALVVFE